MFMFGGFNGNGNRAYAQPVMKFKDKRKRTGGTLYLRKAGRPQGQPKQRETQYQMMYMKRRLRLQTTLVIPLNL